MGPKKVETVRESKKSVGIVKIKTTRETLPYTVKAAYDVVLDKLLLIEEALSAGILDQQNGTYLNNKTRERMCIGDAVDLELVQIEYDEASNTGTVWEEVTQTYSVHAVVDLLNKSKLEFHDAVSRGIIDPDSGEYINTINQQRIPLDDAINKGYIKATLTDNPDKISVSNMGNKRTQDRFDAIRKKVLNPIKVIRGFKNTE